MASCLHPLQTSFLPRLWATRRIGYLLEEIRLQGQNKELADEIRRLGTGQGVHGPDVAAAKSAAAPGGSDHSSSFSGWRTGPKMTRWYMRSM